MFLKSGPVITVAVSVWLLYYILINFESGWPVALFLFMASPFLLVYMAICILKDKEGLDNRTFDDYFYLDRDIPGPGKGD